MKVRLELVDKNAKIKRVVLKADTVIGRSTECGLRIASNEVSRQHCKICLSEEGVTVRDLGSSNGTFINGYQLEQETDYEIAPDSELSIGSIQFIVRFDAPLAAVKPSDGLGSTVDLKPESRGRSDESQASQSQTHDVSLEETVQFGSETEPPPVDAHASIEMDEIPQTNRDELDDPIPEVIIELDEPAPSPKAPREERALESSSTLEPLVPGQETEAEVDSSLGKFFQRFE